jgi:hypothetical protein
MWVDNEIYFTSSAGQAVTVAAASTNQYDAGEDRDVGVGEPLMIVTVITVALTDAGSDSDVDVTLETDDNSGFGSPTVRQTLYNIPAVSAIGAGPFAAYIAHGAFVERFAQLRFTPNNGALTTGTFKSFLTKDVQRWKAYADAVTIS